jgi:hypothetical protein
VLTNPKDSFRNRVITGALIVRRIIEQAVRGAQPPAVSIDRMFTAPETRQGPLYILTTSAGPRGSFEERPLTKEEEKTKKTTDPGFARAELMSDGTIKSVMFGTIDVKPTAPAPRCTATPKPSRESEETFAQTW